MALPARPVASIDNVATLEVSGVRADAGSWLTVNYLILSCVASKADVAIGVASLARLEVPACFTRMFTVPDVGLGGAASEMGLDPHGSFREPAVALIAVRRLVATVAALGIVQGLDRVHADEVAAVALGNVVTVVVAGSEIPVDAAAGMAVKTPGLGVALGAVVARLAGKHPVIAEPVTVVVRRNPFALVAAVAVSDRCRSVLFVGHLLSKGHLHKEGRHDNKQ